MDTDPDPDADLDAFELVTSAYPATTLLIIMRRKEINMGRVT
jgi:hypothetical protein